MRSVLVFVALLGLAGIPARGDEGGDALLESLAARSQLVLAVEVEEVKRSQEKLLVGKYVCAVRVVEALRGEKPKGALLAVQIVRQELDERDAHPLLKKGERCVLFLRNSGPAAKPLWTNTERWFSVQPDSRGLRLALIPDGPSR